MTMKRSWALAALALLGFGTACNEDEQILAMYGTPNVDYRVQGRVTDLEGNPIEGIEVRGKDGLKSVLSGADGSFNLRDNGQKDNLTLNFTDTDGPQNGSYKAREYRMGFTDEEFVPRDAASEDAGLFVKEHLNITMTEEEQ